MSRIRVSKGWIAIFVLIGVMGGLWLYWEIAARRMKPGFIEAMRSGAVTGLPITLLGKEWTKEEFSRVQIIRLDDSYGPQRSIERRLHTGGGFTISRSQYAYQATLTDNNTGTRYLFGYPRNGSGQWRYVTLRPDSARRW